ncbi:MAG TPA: phosphatase PAP2 family protein [Vicinamibacterales bacterium]|nr:phosphatase PAP2 family protein [Vicinamibacterales bacterium]
MNTRVITAALLVTLLSIITPAAAQDVPEQGASPTAPAIDWLRAPFPQQPAPPATHPEPAHTGFKALFVETGRDFKAFPRRRSTWVILAIGGAAAAIAHPADDNVNQRLTGSTTADRFFAPGKYIGSVYVQAGTAVGLYAIGRYAMPHAAGGSRTNKVSHLGFDLVRSLVVSQALTQAVKYTARRDRPTGECCAFPSGHASAAFATASVLERHLGYRGAVPTFAIAAYVAASRLHDNRHWLSDVVFGGALGVASGWTVVGRHGRSTYAFMPVPVRGGIAVSVTRTPRSRDSNPRPGSTLLSHPALRTSRQAGAAPVP